MKRLVGRKLVDIPDAMADGTYEVKVFCRNCGIKYTTTIIKGTKVDDATCENCGCKELMLQGS
jgi:hypothetical protein